MCVTAYRNFEVDHLVGDRGHVVVEAKPVFASLVCCEHVVSLSLFLSVHHNALRPWLCSWPGDLVVDWREDSGQFMSSIHDHYTGLRTVEISSALYCKVKSNLDSWLIHLCEEALLLIRSHLVRQRGRA